MGKTHANVPLLPSSSNKLLLVMQLYFPLRLSLWFTSPRTLLKKGRKIKDSIGTVAAQHCHSHLKGFKLIPLTVSSTTWAISKPQMIILKGPSLSLCSN